MKLDSHGDWKNTFNFLRRNQNLDHQVYKILQACGEKGVESLRKNTPKDSGYTANCWGYKITKNLNSYTIDFYNTHTNGPHNIAILLQYGHGTGTGGYVVGRDYINPAVRPIFDEIAEIAWKEVTRQ